MMTLIKLPQAKEIVSEIESDANHARFVQNKNGLSIVYCDTLKSHFYKFIHMVENKNPETTRSGIDNIKEQFQNEMAALGYLKYLGIHGPEHFSGGLFDKSLSRIPPFFLEQSLYTAIIATAQLKGCSYQDIAKDRTIDAAKRQGWLDRMRCTLVVDRVILRDFDRTNTNNSLFDKETEQINQYDFNNANVIHPDYHDYPDWREISWRQYTRDTAVDRSAVINMLNEKARILDSNKKDLGSSPYKLFSSRLKSNMDFVATSSLFVDAKPSC